MIKLLIADDHQLFIDGIKALLAQEKNMLVVAEALDGLAVLESLKKYAVDVVLLDVSLPKMSGIETCKKIRIYYPQVKVLALTMLSEEVFISGMVKNGAQGYLMKNAGRKELLEAIQIISDGGKYFNEQVKQSLLVSLMPGKKSKPAPFIPHLTSREKEVLKLILIEYNTKEIADFLCISINTVETHRKNLMSKLNVRNTAGLVRIAIERELTH